MHLHSHLAAIALVTLAATPAIGRAQNPTPPASAEANPDAYRYRVLGVYDEQSGDPIEGVEVADVLNGNKALTTKTGTVSLYFLPEGGSLVRLRKVGYEVQTLTIAISPGDTTPVTVVLSHATQLPTVVVKDSAPAHVSALLRGFEERRRNNMGHFVSDSVFRRNENHSLGDVIMSHIPGL